MVTIKRSPPAETGFDAWLAALHIKWTPEQTALVRRAHAVAEAHGGQRRRDDGETWFLHDLAVADILADLGLDHEVVAASLLHAVVAAGGLTLAEVEAQFGAAAAGLVDGVLKLDTIGDLHQGQHDPRQLEQLRKMLLAMAQDVRVVLIKLADRLQALRRLDGLAEAERRRLARETLDIFAPLANRLGIGQIKWALEDLSLRHLDPATYKELARALDQRRADRERYIGTVIDRLGAELRAAGIRAEVSGRAKHIYSIWRKMQRKKLPFEQIFDVRAVRVLVDSVADCYAALGVVHTLWKHIRQEFDDYIANPKSNGYQSLHTAVIGPEGRTLEVQIRTHAMHRNAELGVAAHWHYKEGAAQGSAIDRQIVWLRQLLDLKDDDGDAGDFLDRFRAEALQDRVYVLTPKGTIVDLPQGATPLDFAYHIHTEVGHRCRGAKVNGHIVPLTYELRNADQVEVLTAKTGAPSRDWLNPHLGYLKTPRARAKVRSWFKQEHQDRNVAAGKAALEKEFQRLGVKGQINLDDVARKLNFVRVEDLYAAVGHGDLPTLAVAARAQDLILPHVRPDALPAPRRAHAEDGGGAIKIRGVGNLLTQMATCCKPAPYDAIAGFITRGRGVTIHRQDCANLLNLAARHRERLIEVEWGQAERAVFPVDIQIDAYDRTGLLRDITSVLSNERVNVVAVNTLSDPQTGTARMALTLEISDVEQLGRILARIGQIPNVTQARRKG
ncbi:MAG: GTP diphosphokinase [Pseudomonadota bacterium]|nr:GTP diphosphokinase [Pseudomonadota bacterium]